MSKNNTHLVRIFTVPEEQVAEGDRLFESHKEWMKETHYKTGDKALLSYTVSKKESVDGDAAVSGDAGNTIFVLSEVYESPAGLEDHFEQGQEWESHDAWVKWVESADVARVDGSEVIHSLW